MGALTSKPYSFVARSWELLSIETLDVLDSMLSEIRLEVRGTEIIRVLPVISNVTTWITDKVRYMYDSLLRQRLLQPLFLKERALVSISWFSAFFKILFMFYLYNKKVNFVKGSLVDLEGVVGVKNLNEKLGIKFRNKSLDRASYLLDDLKKYSKLLLGGVNMRAEMPSLFLKVRKLNLTLYLFGIKSNNYKLGFVDLGNNSEVLLKVLRGKFLESRIVSSMYIVFNNILYKNYEKFRILSHKLCLNLLNFSSYSGNIMSHELNVTEDNVCTGTGGVVYSVLNEEVIVNKVENNFVVYQGHHAGTNVLSSVDLLLPTAVFAESRSMYISILGELKKTNIVVKKDARVRYTKEILLGISLFVSDIIVNYSSLLKEILPKKLSRFSIASLSMYFLKKRVVNELLGNFYKMDILSTNSKIISLCSKNYVTEIKLYRINYF